MHDVSIHWYRNGLRFHDNPTLRDAYQQSKTMLPLYVIDPEAPFAQTQGLRPGIIRANFALEAIHEVDTKLQKMNSQMIVILGKPSLIIPEVVSILGASAVYYEQEAAAPVRKADSEVMSAVKNKGELDCAFKGYPTHTLHPMELYLSKCKGNIAPSSYGAFTKMFNSLKVPKEVEEVTQVPPLPDDAVKRLKDKFGDQMRVPTLVDLGYENANEKLATRAKGGIDFTGGEDAGLALLKHMMSRKQWVATFEKPNTSPNALTVDTTGLSPYVKHGCISPRTFYHELSKVYAKFNEKELSKPPVSLHGQLMWREYNYLMGYSTPNFHQMADNPVMRQIPWDDDPQLLKLWENSQTGYPFIDAIMTQLRETGWIHHLARHAVACFLTRGDLWQSWEKGAEIFEYYLIDADWSINNFNWQWLSCSAHFYQYFRCYSPVAFGKKTDPNGTYIKKWLPIFKDMPSKYIYEPWEAPLALQEKCGVIIGKNYPYPIIDHTIVSKGNMGRMKEAYDSQKNGLPMPESHPVERNAKRITFAVASTSEAVVDDPDSPSRKRRKAS